MLIPACFRGERRENTSGTFVSAALLHYMGLLSDVLRKMKEAKRPAGGRRLARIWSPSAALLIASTALFAPCLLLPTLHGVFCQAETILLTTAA